MNDEKLIGIILGDEGPEAAARLDPLAAGDPALGSRLRSLRAVLDSVRDADAGDESALSVSRAQADRLRRLMRAARPSLGERIRHGLDQVAALLVLDTARTPALAGVRGGPGARRVRFEGERFVLDLRISDPGPRDADGTRRVRVTGELDLGERVLESIARRVDDDHEVGIQTDEDGLFSLTLAEGSYLFGARSEARDVVTPPVEISLTG